jgi:hypothetical protein
MRPNSVNVLMKIHQLDEAELCRSSDTGIVIVRNQRAAPGLQEDEDDEHDQAESPRRSVFSTSRIDSSTTSVVLNATWYLTPGEETASRARRAPRRRARDVERVGGRQLDDAEADRVLPWKRSSRDRSRRRARRGRRPSADERSVRAALTMMLSNSAPRGRRPTRAR